VHPDVGSAAGPQYFRSPPRSGSALLPRILFLRFFFNICSSGNRTLGSRFYSDLLEPSVCMHQLILEYSSVVQSARLLVANLRLIPINAHVT